MTPHRLLSTATASAILSALLLTATGCATGPAPQTIAATAASMPQLSTLTRLVNEAGLTETLGGPGPYTVFAPTDDAFRAVPPKTMEALGKDKALLKSVLSYHVMPGAVMSGDIKPGSAKSVQGANLTIARSGSFVTVDDAIVTTADVPATNGVVHIVDRVLMPPTK